MLQYIGKTERTLCEGVQEYLGYIRNKHFNQASGEHFNSHGHKIYHLIASILDRKPGRSLIEIRESFYIQQFETEGHGLNKEINPVMDVMWISFLFCSSKVLLFHKYLQ